MSPPPDPSSPQPQTFRTLYKSRPRRRQLFAKSVTIFQSRVSIKAVIMSAEGDYDENVDDGGMAAPGAPTPLSALEVLQPPHFCCIRSS
jgi:hypothetical protein